VRLLISLKTTRPTHLHLSYEYSGMILKTGASIPPQRQEAAFFTNSTLSPFHLFLLNSLSLSPFSSSSFFVPLIPLFSGVGLARNVNFGTLSSFPFRPYPLHPFIPFPILPFSVLYSLKRRTT